MTPIPRRPYHLDLDIPGGFDGIFDFLNTSPPLHPLFRFVNDYGGVGIYDARELRQILSDTSLQMGYILLS